LLLLQYAWDYVGDNHDFSSVGIIIDYSREVSSDKDTLKFRILYEDLTLCDYKLEDLVNILVWNPSLKMTSKPPYTILAAIVEDYRQIIDSHPSADADMLQHLLLSAATDKCDVKKKDCSDAEEEFLYWNTSGY